MNETSVDSGTAAIPAPRDSTASRALLGLGVGTALLLVWLIYSAVAQLAWLTWLLERGWLAALAVLVVALAGLFVYDRARAKNVAWRALQKRFGTAFAEPAERGNFATGRGQLGDNAYFGLRCFGSAGGLEVARIMSFVNAPLYIPWSAMTKIDAYPNLLTGRKDFETDLQGQISLVDEPDMQVELPWLAEYRQLLPKSVKFRSIKLSKK
jgi:hypothetical protein